MFRPLKLFIVLTISCLGANVVLSQNNNCFVGVRFGAALPMGELASHQYGSGGYALLGKSFGAEAAWFVHSNFGLGVDYSTNFFPFASGFYAEDYQQQDPSFTIIDLLSGPYKVTTYMAGTYYKVRLGRHLSSTLKLMGGIMHARTPDQFYAVNAFMIGKLSFWKTSSRDSKFAFLTGASLEYNIDDRVSLLLQADFTYAEEAFYYLTGNSGYTNYLNMPIFRLQPGINIYF